MDQDSFPDELYCKHNMLLSLRSLGLRSTLSWELVIDCARSIEREGCSSNLDSAASAKARGKELLTFLDVNVNDFFPEFKKKTCVSNKQLF